MLWESLGVLRMTWETGLIQQTEHPRPREGKKPESSGRTPGEPHPGGPLPPRPHLLSQVIWLPAEGKPPAFIMQTMDPMSQHPKPGA